MKKTEYLLL